jgi:DNA-binding GntR family transcriptional regulator
MKAIPSETSGNRAYQAIKEMILYNQLAPGQKITYDQLANKLSMSKTPIISALNRLEQEDLVFYIPNRGFFIKELDREELAGLFNIREALEMIAIEESITNIDPQKIEEIEKAMIVHKQKADEEYKYHTSSRNRLLLDAKFHLKIVEMSKNNYLLKLLKNLFEQIYLRHQGQGIPPTKFIESAKEHKMILDAIKERKVQQARTQMRRHVRGGKIANIKGMLATEKHIRL